jgi:hypothetical protein
MRLVVDTNILVADSDRERLIYRVVYADGQAPIAIAHRSGSLTLPRQVCEHPHT